MLSKQEIFIKVRDHLLAQNKRALKVVSVTGEQLCQYRAPDGSTCAAGCLIKDEFYSSVLEGEGVHTRIVSDALSLSGVDMSDRETLSLVSDLQGLHDTSYPDEWAGGLAHLAQRHNLFATEVK